MNRRLLCARLVLPVAPPRLGAPRMGMISLVTSVYAAAGHDRSDAAGGFFLLTFLWDHSVRWLV